MEDRFSHKLALEPLTLFVRLVEHLVDVNSVSNFLEYRNSTETTGRKDFLLWSITGMY